MKSVRSSSPPAPRLTKAVDIKERPREIAPEVSILHPQVDKELDRIAGIVKGISRGERWPRDEHEARLCLAFLFR